MSAGKMRRSSVVLVGVGFLLLLLSFLPWPVGEPETMGTENEQAAVATIELFAEQQLASEGAALFQAKGCITCHRHDDAISNKDFSAYIGPDLSNYEPNPEFVRAWLRNPADIRPGTQMPDLTLSDMEIDALIAFLASEGENS
jgi:cytochrome c2